MIKFLNCSTVRNAFPFLAFLQGNNIIQAYSQTSAEALLFLTKCNTTQCEIYRAHFSSGVTM